MSKINYRFILPVLIIFTLLCSSRLFAQSELVPPSNKVYDFLDRMLTNKIISGYSSSMAPVSRRDIAKYLTEIKANSSKLSRTDKKFLDDYYVEYSYDINKTIDTKTTSSFFSDVKFSDIFRDKKQKYLYAKADSNSAFFWDGLAEARYIGANGDSYGKPHVSLISIGTRIRGTLFNSLGFYLRLSNGARLGGTLQDAAFATRFDPILASTRKFVSEGSKSFDTFEGYLRYSTPSEWLSITAGREALKLGTGYLDNLLLSNKNSGPFDFVKLDIAYKKIKYSFFHSSIVGNDSAGNQLSSKYLVMHRLEVGPLFNNVFKLGFTEMLIYSNVPVNFAFLNPLSFLTSADLNTELPGKNSNNTLIGIDFQLFPVKKFSLQGTWLIDDLNFGSLGKSGTQSNDNKFGFQGGVNWQDAFVVKNLSFIYEYTRIGPFVYSHRDINNSYSSWNQPLGAALEPNSDEHAIKLSYDFNNRLNVAVTVKHQRSGENVLDSLGNVIYNAGSNILYGRGDNVHENIFLDPKSNRVNRNILIAEITWQPIRQYFISLKVQHQNIDNVYNSTSQSDNIFFGSFRVDY
jgi:hypothetical protein